MGGEVGGIDFWWGESIGGGEGCWFPGGGRMTKFSDGGRGTDSPPPIHYSRENPVVKYRCHLLGTGTLKSALSRE